MLLVIACPVAPAADRATASISLNIVDKSGRLINDIAPDRLSLEADGAAAPIVSLSLDHAPRRVVLLIDTSGSMRMPELNHPGAAKFAAALIPGNARAALATFGEGMVLESAGFEDVVALKTRIANLSKSEPKGRTALLSSIDKSLSLFGEVQFGDSVFVVSDGGDNKSEVTVSKLKQELASRGIRVFLFLLESAEYKQSLEVGRLSEIKDLAKFSGGYMIRVPADLGRNESEVLAQEASRVRDMVAETFKVDLAVGERGKGSLKIKARLRGSSFGELVYPRWAKLR